MEKIATNSKLTSKWKKKRKKHKLEICSRAKIDVRDVQHTNHRLGTVDYSSICVLILNSALNKKASKRFGYTVETEIESESQRWQRHTKYSGEKSFRCEAKNRQNDGCAKSDRALIVSVCSIFFSVCVRVAASTSELRRMENQTNCECGKTMQTNIILARKSGVVAENVEEKKNKWNCVHAICVLKYTYDSDRRRCTERDKRQTLWQKIRQTKQSFVELQTKYTENKRTTKQFFSSSSVRRVLCANEYARERHRHLTVNKKRRSRVDKRWRRERDSIMFQLVIITLCHSSFLFSFCCLFYYDVMTLRVDSLLLLLLFFLCRGRRLQRAFEW